MIITDKYVFFWNGTFSNWHPAKFLDPYNNLTFENTEQAFMWYKAACFNDAETQKLIESTPDPREVKKLGRLVKNYNDEIWTNARYERMIYVNMLKYTENMAYKKELLDTGDKILVEASPYDTVWGIGMLETDPGVEDEANWKGQNLLGKALMDIRNLLTTK